MAAGEILLTFDAWSPEPLAREPVTFGIPFPPGAVPSPNEARLYDGDAEQFCQRQPLALWPDGSVRWLLLDSQVDLPGAQPKTLRLVYGRGPTTAVLDETGISLAETRDEVVLDNGPLRLVCRTRPFELFQSVLLDSVQVLSANESVGFRLADLSGKLYSTAACNRTTVTIEAGGPLRAAVRFDGSHLDDSSHPLLDFSILLTTWADKPYAAVDYQIIHRAGGEAVELHEVSYNLAFTPRDAVRLAAGPALAGRLGPESVRVEATAEACRQAGPDAPAEVLWVARSEGSRGLAVGLRYGLAEFPKRLTASRQGVWVALYPAGDAPLRLHQGCAKTHSMLFHFHGDGPDRAALDRRFQLFGLPPRPRIAPAWWQATGALGPLPARPAFAADALLDEALDHRPRAFGILHFGDEPHPELTARQPDGAPVIWSNNAGDLAHAILLHYARTGQARHFADAEAIVRHVLDVDHVHFSTDPLCDGGLAAPDLDHCRNGLIGPADAWVEGLFDFHHLTGSPQALLAARRAGENLLRHVALLVSQPAGAAGLQPIGCALYSLVVLHRELGKPQYSEAARKLVDLLAKWPAGEIGRHSASLMASDAAATSSGAIGPRWPQKSRMSPAVVLTALARYHEANREQRVADLFLRELDALLALSALPFPPAGPNPAGGYSLPGTRLEAALLLDPLAYAHTLSGERRYLDAAAPFVRHVLLGGRLRIPRVGPSEVQRAGDALLARPTLAPADGVALALVIRPLYAWLAAAEAAGLLDALGLEA